MSRPTVLFPTSGTTWLTTGYQWREASNVVDATGTATNYDTSTHFRYAMWNISNSAFFAVPDSLIQVEKSTNTWSDGNIASSASPESVVDNGTTVTITYQGSTYVFGKPTQWWTNSGSGTSTEGLNQPSGSLSYDVPTSEITWTIDSDSPSSNATDVYAISGPNGYVQQLSHTNGSTSSAGITSATSLAGYWILGSTYLGTYTTLDTLTIGGNPPSSTSQKKVFCNFW